MESNLSYQYGICVRFKFSDSFITYVKEKGFIEATNERINEFSFAYMCNPHVQINKMFTEQVKICLSSTFGDDMVKQINIILKKRYTRVIALIMITKKTTR